jgi:hypothetical protein
VCGDYIDVQRCFLVTMGLVPYFLMGCSADNSAGSGFGPPTPGATGGAPAVGSGGARATGGDLPASGGVISGSGGASLPVTGGTTGTLDPSAFSWPEATADGGASRLCKPGHYVGTYTCMITAPAGQPAAGFQLTGPVDLTLGEAQEGEFLVVSGGTLKTSAGLLSLEGSLTGKLDCQTGKFEGALDAGQLSIPPFPPGGTVDGTLSGVYVPATNGMDGTWVMTGGSSFPGYGCEGPWTLTWTAQ